jgi:hypothetical protein
MTSIWKRKAQAYRFTSGYESRRRQEKHLHGDLCDMNSLVLFDNNRWLVATKSPAASSSNVPEVQ